MEKKIGMIVPTVDNFFFASLVRETGQVLREKGYSMVVCDHPPKDRFLGWQMMIRLL